MIAALAFYMFAFFTILSAVMVVSMRNPVHSVLFLIFAFFNAAGLFVLLGAEFLAMILVIVYVGAVAVLFMFVVMMMDIDFVELRQGFLRYLPIGGAVGLVMLIELIAIVSGWDSITKGHMTLASATPGNVTNTEALGQVIYTQYIYLFQAAGLVLLIAMIGAIVLTHRKREGVRKQIISEQLARKVSDTVEVVKVTTGKGI